MANPNAKGRFVKGMSGNPKGKPPLPPELREIKEFTSDELKRIIAKFLRMDIELVAQVLLDPKLPSINHIIAATIMSAVAKGDIQKAEYLFMRSLGKITDVIEVVKPEPVIIKRLNGEEVALDTKTND